MQISNAYMAADSVSVTAGPKIKGSPHIELEIGKGKGSRHSTLPHPKPDRSPTHCCSA